MIKLILKLNKKSNTQTKGEKHYLDSETLNNAPLNNPEHFLFPIKNPSATPNASTKPADPSESESESTTTTTTTSAAAAPTTQKSSNTRSKQQAVAKGLLNDLEEGELTDNAEGSNRAGGSGDEEGGGDDSSDIDSDSSDDYPSEEKDRFVAQLYKFMDDRGTPMNKVPTINKIDLDLHKFFVVVRKFGGFNKVRYFFSRIFQFKHLCIDSECYK